MDDYYIHPDLNVIALVDPHNEASGDELSEHGKQVVRESLQAQGYAEVVFIPAAEMAQHVAANSGKWLAPDSQPREGWQYFDAPPAEVLVHDAGIDFTDEAMWAD